MASARTLGTSLRVVAACALAYFSSARLVALTSQLAHRIGMTRADAVMLAVMLGFGYLWLILIWAFSRERIIGTWVFLGVLTMLAALASTMMGTGA